MSTPSIVQCGSLVDAITQVRDQPPASPMQRKAAALGMRFAATEAVGQTAFYKDTLAVLDRLSHAKAEIDAAAKHEAGITHITAAILCAAQQYVAEETVPCTEWPKPSEVAAIVAMKATEFFH